MLVLTWIVANPLIIWMAAAGLGTLIGHKTAIDTFDQLGYLPRARSHVPRRRSSRRWRRCGQSHHRADVACHRWTRGKSRGQSWCVNHHLSCHCVSRRVAVLIVTHQLPAWLNPHIDLILSLALVTDRRRMNSSPTKMVKTERTISQYGESSPSNGPM